MPQSSQTEGTVRDRGSQTDYKDTVVSNCELTPLQDEGLVQAEQISIIKRNSCGKALDIARKVR